MNLKRAWRHLRYGSGLKPSEAKELWELSIQHDLRLFEEHLDRAAQREEQGGGLYIYYPPPAHERAPYLKLCGMGVLLRAGYGMEEAAEYVDGWNSSPSMMHMISRTGA